MNPPLQPADSEGEQIWFLVWVFMACGLDAVSLLCAYASVYLSISRARSRPKVHLAMNVACLSTMTTAPCLATEYSSQSMDSKRLMKKLNAANENLKKFSHVNKKALDQYVSFSEQRETILKRKNEIDAAQTAIKELIEGLDLQKDEVWLSRGSACGGRGRCCCRVVVVVVVVAAAVIVFAVGTVP